MHFSILAKRSSLLLFLVLIAFYCYGLGHLPLLGPDEPRYAQVAREMFLRGDLVTPTLGGRPWFEKPVLLYWMMMGSFKLFGVSEWSARLPSALSGLLTVAAAYYAGNRVAGTVERDQSPELLPLGFWSALVAATTIGIAVFARGASFDIVLTMTTTWALAFYFSYSLDEQQDRAKLPALIGFYIFVGLALLAKGLVGIVIPFGVVGLFYLFQRTLPGRTTLLSLLWGLPVALLVAATWYAPVIAKNGWPFVDQFFIQHHFARYISNKYHHSQPVYYYLIVIPLLALPWTALLVDRLRPSRWRPSRVEKSGSQLVDESLNRLRLYSLAWLLFPLMFFSFSSSKLPGYILPVLPAAALLVGERLWRVGGKNEPNRRPMRFTGALYLLFAIGIAIYARSTSAISVVCLLFLVVPLVLTAGVVFARPSAVSSVFAVAGSTLFVMTVALYCVAPQVAGQESSRRLIELADARGYSGSVIYGMERSDRTPEFYAAGRVIYAGDGEPIMYEAPWDVIQESKRRKEPVLAFVPLDELERFAKETSAQTEVIGNNGRYAIVAVRALW